MWEKHAVSCYKFSWVKSAFDMVCKSINETLIYTRIVMMLNISNKRFRSSFFFAPKKTYFLLHQFNGSVDNIQFEGYCTADAEVYLEALSRVECQWPSKERLGMYIILTKNIVTVYNNRTSFIACSHSSSIYLTVNQNKSTHTCLCSRMLYLLRGEAILWIFQTFKFHFLKFHHKRHNWKISTRFVASTTPLFYFSPLLLLLPSIFRRTYRTRKRTRYAECLQITDMNRMKKYELPRCC